MKILFTFFLLVTQGFAHDYKLGQLKIEHPFARATPNGAKVAGGYMIITNTGTISDRLIGATVAFSQRVEIHEMSVENNIMRMREVAGGLVINPGQTVELKPGGYHMMFMGLSEGLKKGDRHKAALTFEKAGTIEVELQVEAIGMHHAH